MTSAQGVAATEVICAAQARRGGYHRLLARLRAIAAGSKNARHARRSANTPTLADDYAPLARRVSDSPGRRLGERAWRNARMLAALLEDEHAYTAEHSTSVVELACAVAEECGLPEAVRERVALAALLHDVGKIVVPTEILDKPGPLTPREFELVKRHTLSGAAIIVGTDPELAEIAAIVRASHERFDGRGYPLGLAGEEIPIEARIVFVCDAYDAMTSRRAYRSPWPEALALAELQRSAGTQFDPQVVDALTAVVRRQRAQRSRRGEPR